MPSSPHLGSAFGLLIGASEELPGLGPPHRDGTPDLCIELGRIPPELRPRDSASPVYAQPEEHGRAAIRVDHGPGGGLFIRFQDGCEFATDPTVERIWCTWPPHYQRTDIAIYLLGPLMALALRRRGFTVLHASGVVDGAGALALAGPPGAGKSTTAAALVARGLRPLTDDVLALRESAGGVVEALPGPPRLRLWTDSAEALFGGAHDLPPLTPNWDKRYLEPAEWQTGPVPVRALYLLGDREPGDAAPRIGPVDPREALLTLIGHSYHGWLSDPEQRARDLRLLGRLIRQAPPRLIVPRDDPAGLDELARLIASETP